MKVINNQNPLVIIDWDDFEKIIGYLPKDKLVEMFFEEDQRKDMKKLPCSEIVNQIFYNYEEDIMGLY